MAEITLETSFITIRLSKDGNDNLQARAEFPTSSTPDLPFDRFMQEWSTLTQQVQGFSTLVQGELPVEIPADWTW